MLGGATRNRATNSYHSGTRLQKLPESHRPTSPRDFLPRTANTRCMLNFRGASWICSRLPKKVYTVCTFAVGTSCVFFVSCVSLAPFCYVSSLLAWGIVIAGISLTKLQKCEEPFLDLFFNRFTSELIFWFLFVFCVMTKLKLYEILF